MCTFIPPLWGMDRVPENLITSLKCHTFAYAYFARATVTLVDSKSHNNKSLYLLKHNQTSSTNMTVAVVVRTLAICLCFCPAGKEMPSPREYVWNSFSNFISILPSKTYPRWPFSHQCAGIFCEYSTSLSCRFPTLWTFCLTPLMGETHDRDLKSTLYCISPPSCQARSDCSDFRFTLYL